jgi:para-aminobenzoate synthetase component 1
METAKKGFAQYFNSSSLENSRLFCRYSTKNLSQNFKDKDFHQLPLAIINQMATENYYPEDLDFTLLFSGRANEEKHSFSYFAIFPERHFIDNLAELQDFINSLSTEKENLPNQWLFGNLSYEFAKNFENFSFATNYGGIADLAKQHNSNINNHQFYLVNFATIIEFNHDTQEIIIFSQSEKQKETAEIMIESALKHRLEAIKINNKSLLKAQNIQSNFSDNQYLEAINNIKIRITAGDCYQANLTRKFFGTLSKKINRKDAVLAFVNLANISPANYSAIIKQGDKYIISASPELFLLIEDSKITSKPIKGTVARGKNAEEDNKNYLYLKNSEKEKAENLMIVDLVRNDLARCCKVSSVKVAELFKITSYSQIFHLSSIINGVLLTKTTVLEAISCCFPAGSMTGAPKIKAVEIASELENCQRGIYSGAIGVIKDNKSANLSVVIRTIILSDNYFEFQVGGAITFDSIAKNELQEIYHKARAIINLLQLEDLLAKWDCRKITSNLE